jgi:tripartite-type tricarboxylate transporter receptor subunit TctC
VPTFKEKKIDLEYGAWRGIAGPKGTSPEVLDKLLKVFQSSLNSKDVKDKFAKAEYPLMAKGPKDFDSYMRTDFENVKQILSMLK